MSNDDLTVGVQYNFEIVRPGDLSSVPYNNSYTYRGSGGAWFDTVEAEGCYIFERTTDAPHLPAWLAVKVQDLANATPSST